MYAWQGDLVWVSIIATTFMNCYPINLLEFRPVVSLREVQHLQIGTLLVFQWFVNQAILNNEYSIMNFSNKLMVSQWVSLYLL